MGDKRPQVRLDLVLRNGTAALALRAFGAEGAAAPVASRRRAVRKDGSGGQVPLRGETPVVRPDEALVAGRKPGKAEKEALAGTRDAVIDEPREGVATARLPEPRRHEPAAQHGDHSREPVPGEADHGEGAEGLAQVVQGDADGIGGVFLDEGLHPAGKHGHKRVGFVLPGGPEEILRPEGREAAVLVIGQRDRDAGPASLPGEQTVDVVDAAAVPVRVAVELRAPEGREMLRQSPAGPVRPGIPAPADRAGSLGQEAQLAFQACVPHGAAHPVFLQAPGQPRNAAGRLTGPGDGGMDEQDVLDGSTPCPAGRFSRQRGSGPRDREAGRLHGSGFQRPPSPSPRYLPKYRLTRRISCANYT